MLNVDMLFNQLQKRNIDPVYIEAVVVRKIRWTPFLCGDGAIFTSPTAPHQCNIVLHVELFPQHSVKFPESALKTTVEANPMLKKAKLKTELSLIYENPEFRVGSVAVPLYQFFIENNLQSASQDRNHHTYDNREICRRSHRQSHMLCRDPQRRDFPYNYKLSLKQQQSQGRTATCRQVSIVTNDHKEGQQKIKASTTMNIMDVVKYPRDAQVIVSDKVNAELGKNATLTCTPHVDGFIHLTPH
ncbi:Nectin-3-like protein [Labeo rohita]|uniref:Nectin-3-like protein n=1 Tax=Labeo rohita TaxID=84645 RepID=A0ABQ8MS89_LABRO|nr:Nectin-3-like protein [Labeo rohita]